MNVLYEDNHLLVVNKPAGVATMGAQPGVPTVYDWAAKYIREKYNKPGNVFVGIVSRLDRLTSGVIVVARTSKAASRLSIQFGGPGKSKKVSTKAEKLYLALIQGDPVVESGVSNSGTLTNSIWKDESAQRMRVARRGRSDAQEAKLEYQVLERSADQTLLAVRLLTGRKHQIRCQFAHLGHPIVGDKKYGGEPVALSSIAETDGIGLHSWRLKIGHPTKQQGMHFVAPLPKVWNRWMPEIPAESEIETRVAEQQNWCIGDSQR